MAARVLSSIKDERLVAEKSCGRGVGKISGDRDARLGISSWRCLPARSPPMPKASR